MLQRQPLACVPVSFFTYIWSFAVVVVTIKFTYDSTCNARIYRSIAALYSRSMRARSLLISTSAALYSVSTAAIFCCKSPVLLRRGFKRLHALAKLHCPLQYILALLLNVLLVYTVPLLPVAVSCANTVDTCFSLLAHEVSPLI